VQQQSVIGEEQSPVLSDITKAALSIEATHGRENPQDKTGVTDTPNPANIIGKAGNKAQETSAETTTEAGKATTSLPPQKELPSTNGSYAAYKLNPAHPDKPADINNTAGRPKTTQKTEGAGKNNATPDKGEPWLIQPRTAKLPKMLPDLKPDLIGTEKKILIFPCGRRADLTTKTLLSFRKRISLKQIPNRQT